MVGRAYFARVSELRNSSMTGVRTRRLFARWGFFWQSRCLPRRLSGALLNRQVRLAYSSTVWRAGNRQVGAVVLVDRSRAVKVVPSSSLPEIRDRTGYDQRRVRHLGL